MASQLQKKKLCWNCEGTVSFHEETCPYCGVSVIPAFLEGAGADFSPPYSKHHEQELDIPRSPYALNSNDAKNEEAGSQTEKEDAEPALDDFKSSMTAISLLLSGSVFLLFSLALSLFSKEGVLTLQWDGTVWYVYLLVGIPLMLLGWKSLMKID